MTRLVCRSVVCLPILVVGLLAAQVAWTQSATQQRESAVLKARAGQMAEAQSALRAMLAAGIDDGLVAMDLATLLQQDGKSAEAVAVFEKAAKPDPPDYALLAATRAYRDLRRYGDAARPRRHGMAAGPVAGPERRRQVGRGPADPAPAGGPTRARGRAPAGRGLCLAPRRRCVQGDARLWRGDQGGAGQQGRARRSGRRVAGHGR